MSQIEQPVEAVGKKRREALQSYTGNFVQNLSPDSRVLDILRDAFKSGFDAGYVAGVKSVGIL